MSNYQYTSDLLATVLEKAGEKTDGTSDFASMALTLINRAYFDITQGGAEFLPTVNEDWLWLRERSTITLETVITTGTVSVTNNSASITFSSAPAKDLDDWFFKVDTHEDVFRISAHTAAQAGATLDSVYTGDTDATANYKVFKLEYTLATGAQRILSPMRIQRTNNKKKRIDGISIDRIPADNLVRAGIPDNFALISETIVRFDKYVETEMVRVDYWYKKLPSDLTNGASEEPLVPWKYRKVIADIALYYLLIDMNDDRSEVHGLVAKNGIRAMASENRHRLMAADNNFGKVYSRYGDHLRNVTLIAEEPYV